MLIRYKLAIAFGSMGLLACGAGVTAVLLIRGVTVDMAQIVQGSVAKPKAADAVATALQNVGRHWQELRAQRDSKTVEETPGRDVATTVTQSVETFERSLTAAREVTAYSLTLASAEGDNDEINAAKRELALLDEIRDQFAALKALLERRLAVPDSTLDASGVMLLPAWELHFDKLTTLVNSYHNGAEAQLDGEVRAVEKSLGHASQVMLGSTLAILAAGGLLAWFTSRAFSRPLKVLSAAARRFGQGHLDSAIVIHSKDEFGLLGEAFNGMAVDLHASMNYADGILRSLVSSLIVVRPDLTIKSVNDSTLKMLGYAEAELIGQPLTCVMQTRGDGLPSVLDGAMQYGVSDLELSYRTKAGVSFPVSLSTSVLRNAAGAPTGLVCVARDISEHNRAEAALQVAHQELMVASRHAGMAEVATGVLHNVGNVLNSVNVSATLVADHVRRSKGANVAKLATLFAEHRHDLPAFLTQDPRGRMIPDYLATLDESLAEERKTVSTELDHLCKNIEHIKDIVSMQQNYAKNSGVIETGELSDFVEDALRMSASSLVRHDVKLVRDFQVRPMISTDKHKIMQILINLLRNAKYACDESGRTDKQITVRITSGAQRVMIAIIDNGVGIPPENVTRVFEHGFTTRKEGHGFGLHSGALAATELGGALHLQSGGTGQGATFVLELPLHSQPSGHASYTR